MKRPPVEKVHEALSALADNRVILHEDTATVKSSDGGKEYTVTWKEKTYTSNDNATYWQGYPGYPVIAVLIKQDKLSADEAIMKQFKGINWNRLNEEYKRDYSKAVEHIITERKLDKDKVAREIQRIYDELLSLDITIKRGSSRPPKSNKA